MGRVADTASLVLGAWRVRPRGRRILWTISLLLALSGAGMLSYPYATDFFSIREQAKLAVEFRSPQFRTQYLARDVEPGQAVMRIVIPKIGVDALVVEGTDPRALRAGAGRYRSTALACEPGNVGIAGHRTTYGKPFNQLDELLPGDEITLVTPHTSCTYRITDGPARAPRPRPGAAGWITHPDDGAVIGPLSGSWLTLTTCHPKGSAAKRLILRAVLVA